MKKLVLVACALGLMATTANAATRGPSRADTILTDMTIGAIVGGIAGGVLCLGHPVCVIAGAKLSALGGAAVGAGFGAASGTVIAVVAH